MTLEELKKKIRNRKRSSADLKSFLVWEFSEFDWDKGVAFMKNVNLSGKEKPYEMELLLVRDDCFNAWSLSVIKDELWSGFEADELKFFSVILEILNEALKKERDKKFIRCRDCAYLVEGDEAKWICDDCGKDICSIEDNECSANQNW